MCNKIDEFLGRMQEFFPETKKNFNKSIEDNSGLFETVVIEDVFMPEIIKLLKENINLKLLEAVFQYIEEIIYDEEPYVIDMLSVTMFEILGNDEEILTNAKKYMGPKTMAYQVEADRALGRV